MPLPTRSLLSTALQTFSIRRGEKHARLIDVRLRRHLGGRRAMLGNAEVEARLALSEARGFQEAMGHNRCVGDEMIHEGRGIEMARQVVRRAQLRSNCLAQCE